LDSSGPTTRFSYFNGFNEINPGYVEKCKEKYGSDYYD
jgi:hypothetical protein